MNNDQVETEIQAKGLNAPRITPKHIEAQIAAEHYFTAAEGLLGARVVEAQHGNGSSPREVSLATPQSLALLTICVLLLKNGFTVTGESACASPANFDAELGRKIARQHAVEKIWPLEGYLLKSQLIPASTGVSGSAS